jgi:cytochrome c biogenesis protein CcmG, thiol:disulfide interchange protein DsbE
VETAPSLNGRKERPDRVFKWVSVAVGICLVAFVTFVIVRGHSHHTPVSSAALESGPPPVLKAGTPGPLFSLPALDGGAPVTLADFRGTPVMVNFFASWCPDCREELSAVARVASASGGRVAVVGVDSNETSATRARQLLAAAHATYPVAEDANAKVASAYAVQALPITYFLNAQGRVVGAALGPQTVASLERWRNRLEGRR